MIYLATDHAGFRLKESVKKFLEKNNIPYTDMGAKTYKKTDDYPDYIIPAAKKIAKNPKNKGIVFGGSGQGEAMAANRIKGIRAAVYYGGPEKIIRLSRAHNDANILSLGARLITEKQALKVVKLWLKTPFSQITRHKRRIKKIGRLT